jgi:hypothetical protein
VAYHRPSACVRRRGRPAAAPPPCLFCAQFVADGVFFAELNELLVRELAEDGYSGVEVRQTPMRTEIIIRATRTQNVLGELCGRYQLGWEIDCMRYLALWGCWAVGACASAVELLQQQRSISWSVAGAEQLPWQHVRALKHENKYFRYHIAGDKTEISAAPPWL